MWAARSWYTLVSWRRRWTGSWFWPASWFRPWPGSWTSRFWTTTRTTPRHRTRSWSATWTTTRRSWTIAVRNNTLRFRSRRVCFVAAIITACYLKFATVTIRFTRGNRSLRDNTTLLFRRKPFLLGLALLCLFFGLSFFTATFFFWSIAIAVTTISPLLATTPYRWFSFLRALFALLIVRTWTTAIASTWIRYISIAFLRSTTTC